MMSKRTQGLAPLEIAKSHGQEKMYGKKLEQRKSLTGFTLLELLIVIAIIAILAVALIIVLNPAETLRKSRDVQRISDLNTMKNVIGIYTTTVSPVLLAGIVNNTACKSGSAYAAGDLIYYSLVSTTAITDTLLDGSIVASQPAASQATAANQPLTNGTGWLPINFDAVAGGSPISNLPLDPTDNVAVGTSTLAAVTGEALVYRYACHDTNLTYEINANLESTAFTAGGDDKELKDGGNSAILYEIGTKLDILGANSNAAGNAAGF